MSADSLAAQVIDTFVQVQREQRRRRQREGIEAAKARGVYQGRVRRLTEDQVSTAIRDITAGVPKTVIARRLGVARQTLYTALDRRQAHGF